MEEDRWDLRPGGAKASGEGARESCGVEGGKDRWKSKLVSLVDLSTRRSVVEGGEAA